jgi:hypothetical protein
MKKILPLVVLALLFTASRDLAADQAAFEYRVMSLVEMFEGLPEASKVMEIAVQVKTTSGGPSFNRTDMDAADYQKALNRLAGQGWELVTVNKSNYWVFRRPAKGTDK